MFPKKIAHVVCTFPPYRGGIGQVAYETARLQGKGGHHVTVFTPFYRRMKTKEAPKQGEFSVCLLRPLFALGNAACVPQLLWKLRGFDLVHLHFPFFGGAEWVWLLKRLRGKKMKLLIRYHMDVVGRGWLAAFFSFYSRLITPRILRSADAILASSLDYIKHSGINALFQKQRQKFYEVPFGVDTTLFSPKQRDVALAQRYGLRGDDTVLLFVGGLDRAHYFKGLEYLLRALEKLSPVSCTLLVIGQPGDLMAYYKDLAKKLGISERVIFAGSVPHDELPKHYQLCDIFVLPSIDASEAFGLVYLEAQACGKPVICSDLPGVRTTIEDGVSGFCVPPRDADALAGALEKLLRDPELRKRMGAAGRKRIVDNYSWERTVTEVESTYWQVF